MISKFIVLLLVFSSTYCQQLAQFTLQYPNSPTYPLPQPTPIANKCCDDNIIIVSGNGQSTAAPDIATLSLTFQQTATTSQAALQALNIQVQAARNRLQQLNIASSDISTTSISISPQFNFNNGVSTIVGQIASQSFSVIIRNIGVAGANIGPIIDNLSQINGIIIQGISFDLQNKNNVINQARSSAFQDAKTKAADYASFGNRKIGAVRNVSESQSQSNPILFDQMEAKASASTVIKASDLSFSVSATVTFNLI